MNTRAIVTAASCLALGFTLPERAYAEPGLLTSPASQEVAPPSADAMVEDAPDVLADELVVDLRDDLSESEINELAAEYAMPLRDNSPEIKDDGKVTVAHVPSRALPDLMARLISDPRVEAAEPAIVARILWTPNDPKFGDQWHMKRAGSDRAWEYACGQGVTVAVVDTGIACYDEQGFRKGTDLGGTACVAGYNFVGKNAVAADDQGHGTHVAGTIAQTTNNGIGVAGLAHCAKLMPVKVLSSRGWGTMADVAEGIRWAADHGAQVINLSLGAPMKSSVVEKAVKHALSRGVLVIAAAGNSGRSVGWPAAYDGVIAVSATDRNDKIAWFSSRGPEIAIGAPGVAVTQQTICDAGKNQCEQWGVFNGTSMAAPHVAAAAALLVSQGVTAPSRVRSILASTATPKDDPKLFGAGILDAGAAVARTHWRHVLERLVALSVVGFLLARSIRRKGGTFKLGPGATVGALTTGVGLLAFLPLFGLVARAGSARVAVELLMKPLGEWTVMLAPAAHAWLPLASALPILGLTALFFGLRSARSVVGGAALGTAALLLQLGLGGEALYALGPFVRAGWCVLNGLVCLWVARICLDASKS
jgi:serine protease